MTQPPIPVTALDRVELNSSAIDWLLHERVERAGGSCARLTHRRLPETPNPRLSVSCQGAAHDLCIPATLTGAGLVGWTCRCLCHRADR